jgi:hypothetical protein
MNTEQTENLLDALTELELIREENAKLKAAPKETMRLLRDALAVVEEHADSEAAFWGEEDKHGLASDAQKLVNEIRDHLAALQKTKGPQ